MNTTTDLWFASFLLLSGYTVDSFEKVSTYKGRYKFNISDEDWCRMKLEFIKSDISKVKVTQEQLKDLIF